MFSVDLKSDVAARSRRIIEELAGRFPSRSGLNPDSLRRAAEYIEQEFANLGLVVRSHSYSTPGGPARNIVAEQPGSEPRLHSIVIGAHYDTVLGTPGADDNASGIAGVIELARLLKSYPNRRTLRFAAFPHEEPPYFDTPQMGSMQYARHLKQSGTGVMVMLSLEMIGYGGPGLPQSYPFPLMRGLGRYPEHGNFIALVGNLRTTRITRTIRAVMRNACLIGVESLNGPGFVPPLFLSDHHAFWTHGYPAVMVTDTAFLRNPYYHDGGDTPDTLNYDFLAEVVLGIHESILALDREGK